MTREDVDRRGRLQSLHRATAVLEALTVHKKSTAIELAQATGLDRTVVHRILQSLELEQMVSREKHSYSLGPRVLLLGTSYLDHLTVRQTALPFILDLRDRIIREQSWLLSLSVPVGSHVVLVDRVWGTSAPLVGIFDIGNVYPIWASASGRSILGAMEPDAAELAVGSESWPSVRDEIAAIRGGEKYATSSGEMHPGFAALAMPIFDHNSRPTAALVISGVGLEPYLSVGSPIALELRAATRQISRLLGAPDPYPRGGAMKQEVATVSTAPKP